MPSTPRWTYAHAVRRWRLRWVPRLARVLAALTIAGLGGAVVALPGRAQTTTCDQVRAIGCPDRLAFGLSTPGLPTKTDALTSLETKLGRTADVALTFTSFRYWFDQSALGALSRAGRMPMITWEPWDPTAPDQDRYPLAGIARGDSDAYLTAQAARIKELGRPVALRFAHEMNGDWYPWGTGGAGTAADYVAAYRHVHDVFAAAGVRNVTWVWSPALIGGPASADLAAFYPGDAYVDWVGLSVYFDEATDTWARTVVPTLRVLDTVAPTRPIYVAEAGVLPGSTRGPMIHDLLGSLLRTPRAIGLTWFDIASRHDWRIDSDAAALQAVREETASAWYSATVPGPAPLVQVDPVVTGTGQVGGTLTGSLGVWRGATTLTGDWLRCTGTSPASCSTVSRGADAPDGLVLDQASAGVLVRYRVVAQGPGGSSVALSAPTEVVATPARPAPPTVEAYASALRVAFPAPPVGTTHWRLRVDGKPYQLVPVTTAVYWLTGLTTGTPVTVDLVAVRSAGGLVVESEPTTGTVAPIAQPYAPYVSVTDETVTFTLPQAPTGASGWLLTVDGTSQLLPLAPRGTTHTWTAGTPHTWTLVAVTGSWPGRAYGAATPASTGTVTPLATPAAPAVVPGACSLTFTLPPVPAGATGWTLTVGPATYKAAAGATTITATGLYPGYPATWTLRATNAGARSATVTGTGTALPPIC